MSEQTVNRRQSARTCLNSLGVRCETSERQVLLRTNSGVRKNRGLPVKCLPKQFREKEKCVIVPMVFVYGGIKLRCSSSGVSVAFLSSCVLLYRAPIRFIHPTVSSCPAL